MQRYRLARCRFLHLEGDLVAEHHALGREIKVGAMEAAVGTGIGSQLAVLAVAVGEHRAAALAHLGIGHHVLRLVHVLAHAEGHGLVGDLLGDDGAQRVVGVVQEHGVGAFGERLGDGILHAVDLAAAVQLVAEQVQQQHVAGLHLRKRMGKPQLVAFEHAPFHRALGLQQRAGNAVGQVGARAVAGDALALALQRVGDHVGDGGLAVGAHHHDGALGYLAHLLGDDLRVHLEGDLAGKVGRRAARQVAKPPG